MSDPSPSTEPDLRAPGPAAPANPSGPARAPGSRTPRHVQWASAVDEDEVAGRIHGRDPESEAVSSHELDEAGLDVCTFSLLTFLTHRFFFFSQPAAFQTLTHALERHHRSHSTSPLPTPSASTQRFRQSSSHTTSSAESESSVPASPRHPASDINLPGEAFIEPHERAGLPVPRLKERDGAFSDSELRAANVVHAHSRNPFKFSRRFYHRRPRSTKVRYANKGADQEKAVDMGSPMARTHGGILAALLTLYDRDSDMASVSDTTTESYSAGTRTPDCGPRDFRNHSLLDLASGSGRRLATASKALHLPEPRPRRERNGAGVWGSLIASTTGALVGAAAPTHSTIAPDVKRPGYHLSRWVICLRFETFHSC
jgi:hypothetical protein